MSKVNLDECVLITSREYCDLVNPEFVGQTKMDDNCMYFMVFSCNGIMYKTHNTL